MGKWRDGEMERCRDAEQQKVARRIEKADERPLVIKYVVGMPQAVGCELWSGW